MHALFNRFTSNVLLYYRLEFLDDKTLQQYSDADT